MFLDRFSSLDDLPKRLYGNDMAVLKALSKAERFSCFEMTGGLFDTIKRLEQRGLLRIEKDTPYPWTNTPFTAIGRAMLNEGAILAQTTPPAAPAEGD
jgi:hypothetical protein